MKKGDASSGASMSDDDFDDDRGDGARGGRSSSPSGRKASSRSKKNSSTTQNIFKKKMGKRADGNQSVDEDGEDGERPDLLQNKGRHVRGDLSQRNQIKSRRGGGITT